jgi:hypothetical protein
MKDLLWNLSVKSLENIKTYITPDRGDYDYICEYLISDGFFTSPCSSKFHLSFRGGLLLHSSNVTKSIFEFANNNQAKFKSLVNQRSLFIVGFFHDLCKMDLYLPESKRARLPNGQWVDAYKWNVNEKEYPPLGHGEKSLYLTHKLIKLTDDEAVAIRWHMSNFDPAARDFPSSMSFNRAMSSPLLKLLISADYTQSMLTEEKYGIWYNSQYYSIDESEQFDNLIDLDKLRDYYLKNIKD